MGLIPTKQLMDEYFSSIDSERAKKTRGLVDRVELYSYETAIRKELLDMETEEIIEMIQSFYNKRIQSGSKRSLSYSTFTGIASSYRAIFDYYIEHYEIIRNPMQGPKMRSYLKSIKESAEKQTITADMFNDAIRQIHIKNADCEDRADYFELIMRLYYDGFASGEEISSVGANALNQTTGEVSLDRGVIRLTDRTLDLLKKFSRMSAIKLRRGHECDLLSWRGSVFKFIVGRNTSNVFDSQEQVYVSRMINWQLKKGLGETDYQFLNYTNIYYLGFYNYIIVVCGKDRAKEIIASSRNRSDANELLKYANEYHVIDQNITRIRNKLALYVE